MIDEPIMHGGWASREKRLSHETGCCVTGIDLSDEYIDTAQRLTQLLNMQERVKFHAASALELPFNDNAFADVPELRGQLDLTLLGVYMLVGNDIKTKTYNLHRNLDEERVSLIETVAVKPEFERG